jgi:hypothetical protein
MIFFNNFDIINDNPIPLAPIRGQMGDCEFSLPALAEIGSKTNALYNDFFNFIAFFPRQATTLVARLQTPNGEVPITGLGTVTTLGYFTNSLGQKPAAINIDWHSVLNTVGSGCYRLILRASFGSRTLEFKSFQFKVLPFNEYTSEESVRIDWTITGKAGDPNNPKNVRDFANEQFVNCIRLPYALFGKDDSESEQENVRYQNGQKLYVGQNRRVKYTLETGFYPYAVHNFIQFDTLMGNKVTITDFNTENPTLHTETPVSTFGNYEPTWVVGSVTAKAVIECESEFDNHYKFR